MAHGTASATASTAWLSTAASGGGNGREEGDGARAKEGMRADGEEAKKREERLGVVYMGEGQPDVTGDRNGASGEWGERRGARVGWRLQGVRECAREAAVSAWRREVRTSRQWATLRDREKARRRLLGLGSAAQLSARKGRSGAAEGRKRKEKGFPGLFNCLCSILFS